MNDYSPIFISCTQEQYENRHNLEIKPLKETINKEKENDNNSKSDTSQV